MTDPKIRKIKELFETGISAGMIFTQELDRLMEENKYLFNEDEVEYEKNKILIKCMTSDILDALLKSEITPYLWSETLMMLSRHCELMLSEGKRITERFDREEMN